MCDGYQSLEYITRQSFTERAQTGIIERTANAEYVFFSSINGDWFRDAVHLVLHVPSPIDRRRFQLHSIYVFYMRCVHMA